MGTGPIKFKKDTMEYTEGGHAINSFS